MTNDVYSQVSKFQSELDEDEVEVFLYDDTQEEPDTIDDEDYDDYTWEGK